ncbi:hypothetical protein Tsubulata_025051, partial [Turnera subulata]
MDQEALLGLKAAITYDPHNLLARNWTTNTSFCNWVGITCSNRRERVTELNINGMGLVQFHMESLTYLHWWPLPSITTSYMDILQRTYTIIFPTYLHLSENLLRGQIPSGIWKCRKLQSISLSTNYFVGKIPEKLGTYPCSGFCFLAETILLVCMIITIPSNVENVPNLQHLMLQYNNLTGHIPASVFNISTLLRLSLDVNKLSGFLPTTIGNLRDIRSLSLQDNFLSNDPSNPELEFFTSLANCRALTRLRLARNSFSGILPQSIGNLTSNLTHLLMNNNKLVGNIPSELGNLSSLIYLSLRENNLRGAIPATVASMRNLQKIGSFFKQTQWFHSPLSVPTDLHWTSYLIDDNDLRSPIPLSLWGLKDLITLMMGLNSFNGSLAPQVGGMTALLSLDLSGNHFSGDIPSTLGQLEVLQSAYLWRNMFQGVIPESLGGMKGLITLDFVENNLSGNIPKSLEELELLSYFNVSFNGLEGEIPTGGSLKNFTVRSFMSNKALCGPPRLQVPPCSSNDNPHRHSKATKSILL